MEITAAAVLFEAHPHDACGSIAPHYGELVGLSIARGFTHEVRQRFGGPRGCTHTTALLLAMAPVAIQSIWSLQVVDDREAGREWRRPQDLPPEERAQRWAATLNSCHVWDATGRVRSARPRRRGRRHPDPDAPPPRCAWYRSVGCRRGGVNTVDHDPFGLTGFGVAEASRRPGEKWQLAGGRLASWVADMDFPIAPAIVERLTRRVAADVGYPTWADTGRSPLGERFVGRMSERYGWTPDAERLHELADVLQGVSLVVHHLTAPGDGVVLHVPAYPPFLGLLRETGRQLVDVRVAAGSRRARVGLRRARRAPRQAWTGEVLGCGFSATRRTRRVGCSTAPNSSGSPSSPSSTIWW